MSEQQQDNQPEAHDFVLKDRYSVAELRAVMAFLRSERGCPWDRAQDHASLRQNLLEEAYEAIDAIEDGRPDRLCDELGDVLMQVVFHAQMAAEAGQFTFDDIVSGICRKLIARHTHLFGQDQADTPQQVVDNWEKNKRLEKGFQRQSQVLTDVPRSLPALQRSYKVQQKAAQVGFDWTDPEGPLAKIKEELFEVDQARIQETKAQLENEVGDLLFAMVNYARHLNVQPEMALSRATEKFIRRFAAVEQLAETRRLSLESLNLAELDQLWEAVKHNESTGECDETR